MATTSGAGQIGNALNFNGSSSYVDVLNPVGLSITGTLTGEAWIRSNNVNDPGNPRIYDKKASPWQSAAGYTLEYKPGQRNITELGGGSDLLRAEPITREHRLALPGGSAPGQWHRAHLPGRGGHHHGQHGGSAGGQ